MNFFLIKNFQKVTFVNCQKIVYKKNELAPTKKAWNYQKNVMLKMTIPKIA